MAPTPIEKQVADLEKKLLDQADALKKLTDDLAARDEKAAADAVETAAKLADIDALAARVKHLEDTRAAGAPDALAKRIENLEHKTSGTAPAPDEAPPMKWVYPRTGDGVCLPLDEANERLKDKANWRDRPALTIYHRDGSTKKVTPWEADDLLKKDEWEDNPNKHKKG